MSSLVAGKLDLWARKRATTLRVGARLHDVHVDPGAYGIGCSAGEHLTVRISQFEVFAALDLRDGYRGEFLATGVDRERLSGGLAPIGDVAPRLCGETLALLLERLCHPRSLCLSFRGWRGRCSFVRTCTGGLDGRRRMQFAGGLDART
jgi:hypothetical protein